LIGQGVLGDNAPEPFVTGLSQNLFWDGLDDQGQVVDIATAQIEVSIGLTPRFEQFLAYQPSQLTSYLAGLQVDAKGRVYAVCHSAHRFDPQIIRFKRDGSYDEMVYPSDPAHLDAMGVSMGDVYEPTYQIEGVDIPVKESTWRDWIGRWDQFLRMPFIIGPDQKAYLFSTPSEQSGSALRGIVQQEVIDDLDHPWLLPNGKGPYRSVNISVGLAGVQFGPDGTLYVANKRSRPPRPLMKKAESQAPTGRINPFWVSGGAWLVLARPQNYHKLEDTPL